MNTKQAGQDDFLTRKSISRRIAIIYLLIGTILISFSPVYVKIAHVGPTMSGVYRNLFGGLALGLYLIFRKERLRLRSGNYLLPCLCGFVFALDLTAWHKSIHYIGPGLSTLIGNLQVLFLAGFGFLVLKEKLTARIIIAVPLAMIGLLMIFGWHWNLLEYQYKIGIVLALFTAFSYATFTLVLRYHQGKNDSISPASNMLIISFAALLFMSLFSWLQAESFVIPDGQSWCSLLGYGIFSQAIGWVLITRSLPRIKASLIGLILLLQPVLSFVWDIIFFKRPITTLEITGAIIALTAIYLGSTGKSQENHNFED